MNCRNGLDIQKLVYPDTVHHEINRLQIFTILIANYITLILFNIIINNEPKPGAVRRLKSESKTCPADLTSNPFWAHTGASTILLERSVYVHCYN